MWFTRVSIKNPVLATMVMLAFVVFGIVAVQRLKVDQFPNVEFPTVVVAIDYPSAAPEIVEPVPVPPVPVPVENVGAGVVVGWAAPPVAAPPATAGSVPVRALAWQAAQCATPVTR